MLQAIADQEGESRIGDVLRRMIRRRYKTLFAPSTSKFSVSVPRGSVG